MDGFLEVHVLQSPDNQHTESLPAQHICQHTYRAHAQNLANPKMRDREGFLVTYKPMLLQRFFPRVINQRKEASEHTGNMHYCQFDSQVRAPCMRLRIHNPMQLQHGTIFAQPASRIVRSGRRRFPATELWRMPSNCLPCTHRVWASHVMTRALESFGALWTVQVLELWQSSMYLAGACAGAYLRL